MSGQWPVFLTASRPSPKALTRALFLLQDFEFTETGDDSSWTLVTSKTTLSELTKPTPLPVPDFAVNEFAGMSLDDVNAFVRANEAGLKAMELRTGNWVCEQFYNDDEEEEEEIPEDERLTSEFRAVRCPYEEAWSIFCNLDIANMAFEDFVDEEEGVQEDGAWRWGLIDTNEKLEVEAKRQEALKKLQDLGHV
ncbi:hypothetical protein C8J57DRAFT_1271938 [Mycena rebaudengoi]|nr:hypothetical protein C8J57DRAFT_1271938 [Mycena rebaudengoi]